MLRLEDYGIVGDGKSIALIGKNGSIDWLCWPRFDSDACLARLVGGQSAGCWEISALDEARTVTWRYLTDTLILESTVTTSTGSVQLIDFMPLRARTPRLVRRIFGLHGTVPMRSRLALRFGYGLVPPWYQHQDHRSVGRVGPDLICLDSNVSLQLRGNDLESQFSVCAGSKVDFVLSFGSSLEDAPPPLSVDQALEDTQSHWSDWIGGFDKPTDWPCQVRRSLITLKALIDVESGGIIAAPTTSLPEVPGRKLNWDYRYCWLRDSTFALAALLNAGYLEEAKHWREWVLRSIAGSPDHIQIMYRVDGARTITEWVPDWLEGYEWSTPVRIGNAASSQLQVDVFGELIDLFHLAERAGLDPSEHANRVEAAIVDRLETLWEEPGHGIWEVRGQPRQYVYSKVMAWAAVDRVLRRSDQHGPLTDERRNHLRALKARIHQQVCEKGYDPGLEAFVEFYGGTELDASALLLPAVGFLPAKDERIVSTVSRIERELMEDGLLFRSTAAREEGQGAFLACNGWLADCYKAQGRTADARASLERLLSVSSELGLLSEEYNLRSCRLSGNFPQALSHLALVTTALGLCGPVLQRGAG